MQCFSKQSGSGSISLKLSAGGGARVRYNDRAAYWIPSKPSAVDSEAVRRSIHERADACPVAADGGNPPAQEVLSFAIEPGFFVARSGSNLLRTQTGLRLPAIRQGAKRVLRLESSVAEVSSAADRVHVSELLEPPNDQRLGQLFADLLALGVVHRLLRGSIE
jgi:hypothetical protein